MAETLRLPCSHHGVAAGTIPIPSSRLSSIASPASSVHPPPNSSHPRPSISLKKPSFRDPNHKLSNSSAPGPFDLREKLLFLESLGVDVVRVANSHPASIDAAPLGHILSVVDFLRFNGFPDSDIGRILNLCPETLAVSIRKELLPVFTFLLREVGVTGDDLRGVINRRPRLLACSVPDRLRPTLYFLQSLGISDVRKHTALLSCDAEVKFLPRLEFLQSIGFSRRDAVSMVRRFPPLFGYGIESNLRPKFQFLSIEMSRDLGELREFPQYFSFSLENRIKPRHRVSVENRVRLPLSAMLRLSDERFREKMEVCVDSSQPLKASPLSSASGLVAGSRCKDDCEEKGGLLCLKSL